MRSDLLHASPRHSSSLSPRHSLQHRSSPNTPVTQEQMGSELAASSKHSERAGHSSPMHSQVLMDLQRHSTSPRRSPVAMDVELSPSPSTVRHRLTIPDLPHRGEDSPGHRLSACMSEEYRPLNLQASPEASRSPYDRELDKFRPLSPQSSQRQQDDELERFRPLSPASKHRDLESTLENELDKFRPLSPESKRSTMDAEELGKLRMLSPRVGVETLAFQRGGLAASELHQGLAGNFSPGGGGSKARGAHSTACDADPQSLPFLLQSLLSSSFTTADDAPSHGLKDVFQGAADADVPSRSAGFSESSSHFLPAAVANTTAADAATAASAAATHAAADAAANAFANAAITAAIPHPTINTSSAAKRDPAPAVLGELPDDTSYDASAGGCSSGSPCSEVKPSDCPNHSTSVS